MDAPSQTRSIWMGQWNFESGPLSANARADVCVIGAGMAIKDFVEDTCATSAGLQKPSAVTDTRRCAPAREFA